MAKKKADLVYDVQAEAAAILMAIYAPAENLKDTEEYLKSSQLRDIIFPLLDEEYRDGLSILKLMRELKFKHKRIDDTIYYLCSTEVQSV